jgi:hypothetical protein
MRKAAFLLSRPAFQASLLQFFSLFTSKISSLIIDSRNICNYLNSLIQSLPLLLFEKSSQYSSPIERCFQIQFVTPLVSLTKAHFFRNCSDFRPFPRLRFLVFALFSVEFHSNMLQKFDLLSLTLSGENLILYCFDRSQNWEKVSEKVTETKDMYSQGFLERKANRDQINWQLNQKESKE